MPYADTSWATRDPVIASKLQQMSDNDAYLQNEVDNRMPKGLIALSRRITQTTGLTGTFDTAISGLNISFTVPDDRLIEVVFYSRSWSTDTQDTIIGQQIQESGLCIAERNLVLDHIGSGTDGGSVHYIAALDAGTYTFTAGYIIYGPGGAAISMQSSSTRPSYIAAYDIGCSSGLVITET